MTKSVSATERSRANRSTSVQEPSVTTPTGRSFSTTTTAPCARFGSSARASETAASGPSVTGVSATRCLLLTNDTVSATAGAGRSWGSTTRPPRRATVSAMRRPETAVMLATTIGMVVPDPSEVARSTSNREVTSVRFGTRNTSSYVRS